MPPVLYQRPLPLTCLQSKPSKYKPIVGLCSRHLFCHTTYPKTGFGRSTCRACGGWRCCTSDPETRSGSPEGWAAILPAPPPLTREWVRRSTALRKDGFQRNWCTSNLRIPFLLKDLRFSLLSCPAWQHQKEEHFRQLPVNHRDTDHLLSASQWPDFQNAPYKFVYSPRFSSHIAGFP